MVITHVFSDGFSEYNSSHWRGQIPSAALQRAGVKVHLPHVIKWLGDHPDIKRMCSESDLIIIQRVLVEEALDRCRYWLERGKAIVVDFDDSYGLLQDEPFSGNQAAKFWVRGEVEISNQAYGIKYFKKLDRHPIEQFGQGAGFITGLTMPSRILAEDWSWAARCWYIPNYIDSPRYLKWKPQTRRKKDLLTIGYGGSLSHIPSFRDSGILDALERVFRQRKNVEFLFCGDDRVYKMLPIPEGRKHFRNYVTWEDWPRIMSQFDITVAPLHARYDWSRSQIKLVEAGIMGIPIVATACPPYQDWIDNNIGIYVHESGNSEEEKSKRADDWEARLLEVIDNYEERKNEMDSQFEYALTWDVDANVSNLLQTYADIVAHR